MLEGLTPPHRQHPCAIRSLFETLDDSDRIILDSALADFDAWPAKTLSKALADKGVILSEGPVRKHRAGVCSCK